CACQDIEVDEAVIDRRYQDVRHRMAEPHPVGIVARRIDDHEIESLAKPVDDLGEGGEFARLDLADDLALAELHREMRRRLKRKPRLARPAGAILEIARQRKLP